MTFEVVSSLTSDQVDDLMGLYQHTYWAQTRRKKDVERMLVEADYLFGVVDRGSGRLCAFARVISGRRAPLTNINQRYRKNFCSPVDRQNY